MLKLKNLEPNKRKLKLIYYIKPVFGEDEIKNNVLTLKNMNTGNQEQIKVDEIEEYIK